MFFRTAAPLFARGDLDGPFWQQLVPAVSQQMQFAWRSTTSIGLFFEYPVNGANSFTTLDRQWSSAQLTGLRWYAQAVTQMSEAFQQSADQQLLALLSCTLFITCEFQQGYSIAAFGLLEQSGHLFAACISPKSLARAASPMTEELERALIPFSSRHVIELAQLGLPSILNQVDSQALLKGHVRGSKPFGGVGLKLDAFRAELLILLCRSQMAVAIGNLTRNLPNESQRTTNMINELLVELDDWHRYGVEPEDESAHIDRPITVAYLLAYFHVARISVATCHSLTEAIYAEHLEAFKAVLEHASIILASPTVTHHTSFPPFTYGIGPAIYFVATRCRDRTLRHTAISLLHEVPQPLQQNHWSILPATQLAEAAVAFEESFTDADSPCATSERSCAAEHLIHHTRLITRPRPPSRGGGTGRRELAIRFVTYNDRYEIKNYERDLIGNVAFGLGA